MKAAGIEGCHRRKKFRTTRQDRSRAAAADLLNRNFKATGPGQVLVADIKYVTTWEGPLYLAALQYAFSRRIVGWSMRSDLQAELVIDAFEMARQRARLEPVGWIIPIAAPITPASSSDAPSRSILASMGSVGDALDNALAEAFFATLETEWLDRMIRRNRNEARVRIFYFIEGFYNKKRLHSSLGYLSPVDFEELHRKASPQKPRERRTQPR